ncbi:MAG: radical SAM protein [Victivallaceae bacterium]|nr:radical SAM protein [Victivallaceae bacterium]
MPKTELYVVEQFLSVQGESSYAGKLCWFIRLAGCNLNCSYCDTEYAKKFADGSLINIDALVEKAVASKVEIVEVTGGEPLLQSGAAELCENLLAAGLTVLVETNGSLPIDKLPVAVIRIMDVKLPSSGESENILYANFSALHPRDEVKFVISNRTDYDFAKHIIEKQLGADAEREILFSPVWDRITPATLARWVVADKLKVRVQLQLHKYIWPPDMRGV